MTPSRAMPFVAVSFGACVLIGQILIFRELMSVSLGSELAMGLIFAGWLVSVALGSALGGVWMRLRESSHSVTAAVLALCGFSVPLCIALARCVRTWAGYIQGEAVPLDALAWMLPLSSAPAAVFSGLGFALLCRASRTGDDGPDHAPGRIYALDALGGAAGSLLFTFVLVFFAPPMGMSLWLAAAMMLCAALWVSGAARAIAVAACAAAAVSAVGIAPGLESQTRSVQWGNAHIAAVEQSQYGSITAIRHGAQVSLYSNGRLMHVTGANPGAAFRAHAAMSLHPRPRRVLVIGATPDALREILKHGPDRVDVVELDPVLWTLQERFLELKDLKLLNDVRVNVHITDARSFIFSRGADFDVILANAGEPETLLVNRYYTREFFEAVKARLARGGVFALAISFQRNSTSAWQADLLGTHLATLDTVFPRPLLLLGQDATLLAASHGATLTYDPSPALRRFEERGIQAERFDPMMLMEALDENTLAEALKQPRLTGVADARGLLEYDINKDRVGYVFGKLMNRPGARVNRDFEPVSTYYQTRVSGEVFRGGAREFMKRVTRRSLVLWAAGMIGGFALIFVGLRFTGVLGSSVGLSAAAAAAGCAGLALEMVVLFFFQVRNGAVYHFVGLVLAAFMGGGWAGAAFARRFAARRDITPRHAAMPLLMMFFVCALAAVTGGMSAAAAGAPAFLASMGAALCAGALTGACYSLATAAARSPRAAGLIYSADHLGAAIGAACASALVIPLAGVAGALWLCCAVLAAGAVCVLAPGRS